VSGVAVGTGTAAQSSSPAASTGRLVKTRLKPMQYRPALLDGFLASARLEFTRLCNATLKDRKL
jgi:hypothetical protein